MLIKNNGEKPDGIIFSNLGEICEPQSAISQTPVVDKWTCVPYETATISGTMLSAFETASPENVSFNPKLSGWYKIYVSMMDNPGTRAFLKLTDDEAQTSIIPSNESFNWTMMKWDRFQEVFWKCADMTGQSVEFGRRTGMGTATFTLGWLRFVPMSEEEVEKWKKEDEREDTKRIFATCDMYSLVVTQAPEKFEEWHTIIENMKHSDVEIFSLDEDIVEDNYVDTIHGADYSFLSDMRRHLTYAMHKKTKALYVDLIKHGQKNGVKMYLSKRMGARLGPSYPYDGEYVGMEFGKSHSELRCKNRDGEWVEAMSFAYPEVQELVISNFVKMAELGCDGVTLVYTRGIPFVLFEDPVMKRFEELYPGIDPCQLPLADERVHGVHCLIMTEFMRKLRKALDDECQRLGRKPMAVHAYVGNSLKDNRLFGLDVATWAREGLIDSFSAYPLKIVEKLDGLMMDENPELIDLEKYTKATRESFHKVIHRDIEYFFDEARLITHINLEYVKEYVELAKECGIKAYFDILDRTLPAQNYIEAVKALSSAGAEYFSLWDCDIRQETKAEWETASRLGHIEEINNDTLEHNYATLYRILNLGGKSIALYNPTWMG